MLEMPSVEFKVEFSKSEIERETGVDDLVFLIRTHPKASFDNLQKVAYEGCSGEFEIHALYYV
jgi:DNA repair ATPase RecN